MTMGISPTSSRKIVPPCAASKKPARSCKAPVNAPRRWPNSSLSSSDSGTAAQFTAMNGFSPLGLARCSARATSSLPVPVSPVTSTGRSAFMTRAISR